MTTTTTRTETKWEKRFKAPIRHFHPSQTPPQRIFLELGVAFVIIGAWLALWATGIGVGTNPMIGISYRKSAGIIVGILTILLSVWPIIRNIRAKAWPQVGLLVALIPAFWLLTWFAMFIGLKTGLAIALWSIPFFGPLLGVAALILNAVLVFKIGSTGTQNPRLTSYKTALNDAEAEVIKADKKATKAGKAKESTLKGEIKAIRAYETAAQAAEQASKEYSVALETNKGTQTQTDLKIAQDIVAKFNKQREDNQRVLAQSQLPDDIAKSSGDERSDKEKLLTDAQDSLIELEVQSLSAENALLIATQKDWDSETSQKLREATDKRDKTSVIEKQRGDKRDDFKDDVKLKEDKIKRAGERKKNADKELEKAKQSLFDVQSSLDKDGGKHALGLIILFVLSLAFYTVWYGWVLTSAGPGISYN